MLDLRRVMRGRGDLELRASAGYSWEIVLGYGGLRGGMWVDVLVRGE